MKNRTKRNIGWGVIAVVAIAISTLAIAPSAASADDQTEVTSSLDISVATTTIAPSSTSGPVAGQPLSTTEVELQTSEPVSPSTESPAVSTLPTEPKPSESSQAPFTPPGTGTSTPTSTAYTTVLWQIVNGDWTQPQPFVAAAPGIADFEAVKPFMQCGTDYQIDIYKGDPSPLWSTGFLLYGHDGGYLAYDLPFTPYMTVTTEDCPVVTPPTEEPSSPPTTTPPTEEPTAEPSEPSTEPTAPEPEPTTPSTPIASPPAGTGFEQPVDGQNSPKPASLPGLTPSGAAPIVAGDDSTPEPASSSLAYTGSDGGSWLGWGLVLLLAGLIALAFSRFTGRNRRD